MPRASEDGPTVWVFHGEGARFASGVFRVRADALDWVATNRLTGVLTEYPLDIGAYEDAVARGRFVPTKPHHGTPAHVAGFSPATTHVHISEGRPDT